jgi:Winged helix DNA-binding domain
VSLRASRAAAQLLHRPRRLGATELVRRLLAVQAQDLRSARLALRARGAADVDAALDGGELVVAWLNRGTLHLVAAEDYAWLLDLTAPGRMATNRRRLGEEGVPPVDAERAVEVIESALADEGPLTRPELAERIAAHGIRTEGQATPSLLVLAALRGIVVLGPMRGERQAFVLAREWVGERGAPRECAAPGGRRAARASPHAATPGGGAAPAADRAASLAELARRYLAAHGPAAPADLAAWAGLPLRDARVGLDAIAAELAERDDGLVDLAAREPPPDAIPARLLPPFDPYLLGWKDRSFAVPPEHATRVHPGGGMLRATATVDGRVVGTWTAPGGEVHLDLFRPLRPTDAAALQAEAAEVEAFTSARPS